MRKRYILCALCALTIGLCMTAVLVACRGGSGEETSAGSTTGSDEPIGEFTEPEDSETVAGESVTETVAPPVLRSARRFVPLLSGRRRSALRQGRPTMSVPRPTPPQCSAAPFP